MRRPLLSISILFVPLMILASAQAGPLPAPQITPGQFVYTIPSGFDPPMIGRHGLAEIEQSAKKLHYPYYVVLVRELPQSLLEAAGDEDEAAARAIDGLAEDWQKQPRFDVGKSSIFLLCYNPRKYRFLAGTTWKLKLGFERDAHTPFNAIFERSVQGTPKDPKTGIIEMMKAVDEYLFDQTDPGRIAARKEAAARAEQMRRLEEARSSLDQQITRTETLLQRPRQYMPRGVWAYKAAADKARSVRSSGDLKAIQAELAALTKSNAALAQHINTKADEAFQRQVNAGLRGAVVFVVSVIALVLLTLRLRKYRRLRKTFEANAQAWDEKLLNAKAKYADFYGNERGSVIGLADMVGETKDLYARVTAEVDAIYLGVEAMDAHVAKCRVAASKASYFRIFPLEQALADLENEFEFDTGQLDPRNLFGPLTKVLKIKPSDFARELEERFATTIAEWESLKRAAKARGQSAEELFPESKLEAMLALADEQGIPHAWLSDHPLFGSEEEDEKLYDGVDAGRQQDPVAFMRRIDALAGKEQEIEERLHRLVAAIQALKSSRLEKPPQFGETVLSPQDDPRVTFESARREEEKFAGLLAAQSGQAGLDEVETQGRLVQSLYQTCAEQGAAVQTAIEDAGKAVAQAEADLQNADALAARAEARLPEIRAEHSNTGSIESSIRNGSRFAESGREMCRTARTMLQGNRHLDARREAWQASERFEKAAAEFNYALNACDELDRQKAAYERKLSEMSSARERAESRIRRYGGSPGTLDDVPVRHQSGPADYFALLAILQKVEQGWDAQVRRTQRQYEAEQARIRREREAEEARNSRPPWGGWGGGPSSGGGSWGGGGSSSSGGSWSGGGGRSSSSGGSW